MKTTAESFEVLYPAEPDLAPSTSDVDMLKTRAAQSPKRRARLCLHRSRDDALHEMLIVLAGGSYIRPHKHLGIAESLCLLEGQADIVLFDDAGKIQRVFALKPFPSPGHFLHRLDRPVFHTLVVRSDFAVVHEITEGPFKRERTVFAPWAPAETDAEATEKFLKTLFSSKP
jgi:cupin fold WbuC family metalloprotein